MQSRDLKTLLGRVKTWPQSAQIEATKALREIEEDFIVGPNTRNELMVAHDEAQSGHGSSLDDIKERLGL
jgi:hypothetical protein